MSCRLLMTGLVGPFSSGLIAQEASVGIVDVRTLGIEVNYEIQIGDKDFCYLSSFGESRAPIPTYWFVGDQGEFFESSTGDQFGLIPGFEEEQSYTIHRLHAGTTHKGWLVLYDEGAIPPGSVVRIVISIQGFDCSVLNGNQRTILFESEVDTDRFLPLGLTEEAKIVLTSDLYEFDFRSRD